MDFSVTGLATKMIPSALARTWLASWILAENNTMRNVGYLARIISAASVPEIPGMLMSMVQ